MNTVSRLSRQAKPSVIEITSPQGWPRLDLIEVWRHLPIIFILALRDIKVRYKQSLVGVGWVITQPLITVFIFTAIFGRIFELPSGDGTPYALLAMCGLAPWLYFILVVNTTTSCLVANQELITRVYFPRLALPVSCTISGLLDFMIAFVLLLIMLVHFDQGLTARVLLLPFFVLFCMVSVFALGLWLSALNVQYRDVFHALPFLTIVLMLISPVAYPSSIIPDKWQWAYQLNPLATVINGFRWVFLEGQPAPGYYSLISVAIVSVALVGGLYFFRWQEDRFADVV